MTKYKVTASTGFRGHIEDEEFEADLSSDQERRAIERGSIKRVTSKGTSKKKEETNDDE